MSGSCLLLVEAGDLDDELHAWRRGCHATRRVGADALTAPSRASRDRQDVGTAAAPDHAHLRTGGRGRRMPVRGGGLLRLPDVSQLRLVLLAAVGARAAPPRAAVASTPTARRPSIRWRSRSARCCRCSATAPTACSSRSRWRASSRSSPACTGWGAPRSRRSSASSPRVLVVTRFDFPFLAARGYIDIARTSRSSSGPRCSSCAAPAAWLDRSSCCSRSPGLLRPEAWLLAGLYCALGWIARATWPRAHRLRGARGARAAWSGSLTDFLVTGDPLFSLHRDERASPRSWAATRAPARCPRRRGASSSSSPSCRSSSARSRGSLLALVLVPRRLIMPRRAVRSGVATFALVGAGRPVGHRPLPARPVADGRWSSRRRARRLDDAARGHVAAAHLGRRGAASLVLFGIAFTATRVNLDRLDSELQLPRRRARRARRTSSPHPARQGRAALRAGLRRRTTSSSPTRAGSSTCRSDKRHRAQSTTDARRRPTRRRDPRPRPPGALQQALVTESTTRWTRCRPPGFRRVAVRSTTPPMSAVRDAARDAVRQLRPALSSVAARAASSLWRLGGRAASLLLALGLRLWGLEHGPALRLQRRRERALRAARDRDVRPRLEPGLLRQPAGLHVRRCTSSSAVWYGGRDGRVRRVRRRPDRGLVVARVDRARCSARSPSGCSTSPARGSSTAAAACSPPALLAVAFLPVFYSHLALNDVPTLAPLCLALWGVGGRPARRAAGATTSSPGSASASPRRRSTRAGSSCSRCSRRSACTRAHRPARALRGLALAGAVALAAFFVANPYAILDFDAFRDGLSHQSDASGDGGGQARAHPGQRLPLLPVVVRLGAGLGAARRGRRRGPAAGLPARPRRSWRSSSRRRSSSSLFMGSQERFFGRWLLPVFPFVCLLAASAP